jgi:hypothetical protein
MSAGQQVLILLRKAGMILAVLLLVTVFLSAMPGHRAPAVQLTAAVQDPQDSSSTSHDMPGIDMDDAKLNEASAVNDMNREHRDVHSLHMKMTSMRPPDDRDVERAKEISRQLRDGIEKYKDYRVALNDGYKIFLPNLPQLEYHFTNYWNGFLESFNFDPARPTSLLYKKTSAGYELVGAMYTMPKRATEDQLNERVPLSVAMWHLHTNLCMPPKGQYRTADWTKFGLKGSISTSDTCDAAGGRFQPSIFGWMVHVYPFQDSLEKIYPMHHME